MGLTEQYPEKFWKEAHFLECFTNLEVQVFE
jgi:hypothetical protein